MSQNPEVKLARNTELAFTEAHLIDLKHESCIYRYLWTPAQRKRASMLYFANVFLFVYFFMAALFSGPG